MQEKRVAIVADWLIDFGGAELVIEELLKIFPNAEIFTSVCFMKHPMLEGRKIHTSFIQHIPYFNKKHKLAGILRPWAFRRFDFRDFDIIISSSSAESKHAGFSKRGKHTKHFCYCHTPIRYYWSHYEEYKRMMEFGKFWNPIVEFLLPKVVGYMRKLDIEAAEKVDIFWANSKTTQQRIEKYYHRKSEVIYPGTPVADKASESIETAGSKEYYFSIGRCIPYKKFDLLVEAFNSNGKRLILATATDNSLFRELQAQSRPNITWIFRPSNEERDALYKNAKAFLFPPEEDFGLVPVEAMAMGTPVIAYGSGGATETVIDGLTGVFFTPQTAGALNEAIERFETLTLSKQAIIARGKEFSRENFRKHILSSLEKNI